MFVVAARETVVSWNWVLDQSNVTSWGVNTDVAWRRSRKRPIKLMTKINGRDLHQSLSDELYVTSWIGSVGQGGKM